MFGRWPILVLIIFTALNALAETAKMAVLSGTETTSTGDPSDLNQSTAYSIKWSSSEFDATYFEHSTSSFSNQLKIKSAGDYRLYFTMPAVLQDTSNNRRGILADVYVNGSPIESGRFNSSYIRQSGGHAESSLHGVVLLNGLSPNDKIEISLSANITSGKVTTVGAQLTVEYLDPSETLFWGTATQTTNSTNINQTTEYALEWTSVVKDSGYTHSDSSSSENIGLDASGEYLVFVNIPTEVTCATNRNSVKARIKIAGATVTGGSAAQGYMRCLENHDNSSVHWSGVISGVTASQNLTVTVQAETSNLQTTIIPTGRKASILVQKIATTDTIALSGTTVLAGANWNETSGSEIQWATEYFKDAAVFSHSTSTDSEEITVNEDGNYLVVINTHLTSTVQRANPLLRIKLNSSVQQGGVCKTHYIRNQEGHNESSCSMTYLLSGLSSGDIISIETIAEAASGAVDDASPALLTVKKVSDATPPSSGNIVDDTPDKVLHIDAQSLSSVLDESNRIASDTSFSGDVKTWKDISSSASIHDATQASAASRPTFDSVNNFISFDGVNDHFDVANHADLNLAPSLKERSMVTAFKTGPDVTSPQVIYEEGGTIRGMNVYIRAGRLYIGFWNVNNDGDGAQTFTSASTPISANTHYYTTLVLDYSNYTGGAGPNGELRGHINGVEFASLGTTTSLLYSHSGAIGIGAMKSDTYYDNGTVSGNGDYFEGELFELIIYNHAIDNTEAIAFYDYLSDRWPDPQPVTNLALTSQYTTSSTTTPNFTWTASISADVSDYEVALGSTAGATDISGWASKGVVTSANISGLAMTECTNYYASVKAVDTDTNESTAKTTSFLRYDTTVPTDPSSLSITGAASASTSKMLAWTGSTDSCAFSHYQAAIGTSSGASDTVTWTSIGNVMSHQFTGLSLAGATNYYTSIRAYDLAGNVSTVVSSTAWQVDTCVASDVTAPTDPGTFVANGDAGSATTPDHSWTASTDSCGFSHYEISVGTSAAATDTVTWADVGSVLSHKVFNISPTLATNTSYYTNIRAVDLAGNFSSVVSTTAWQLPTPGNVSSGLVMWLDASDTGTVFSNAGCSTAIADGVGVQCWKDKSSAVNHTSSSGSNTPLWEDNEFNSSPVIRFDGTDDVLDFTSAISDIRTVFIVNKSNTTNHQLLLGHTSLQDFYTSSSVLLHPSISSSSLRTGSWRVDQSEVSSPTTFSQTGSYSLISVTTSANVAADHLSSDQKTVGRFFDGDVAEVIIYDRALDSTERTNVENYLYSKWFSAAPAPVTSLNLNSAYTTSSAQSPSFSWTHSSSPDVDHYEVALGTSAGSNDVAGWLDIGLVSNYQFLGLSLSSCSDYFVSVRSVDTDSYVSSFVSSSALKFDNTAPDAPTGVVLSGTAAATVSRDLTWSAAADSCSFAGYEIALGTTSGGSETISWTDIGNVETHQFTGISPDLSQATNYYLSVRSKDSAGNVSTATSSASWQLATCITTDVTAPSNPSGIGISGSATLSKSPTMAWSASTDACAFSNYEVAIGTTSGGSEAVAFTDVGDVGTYQFQNLSPSLSYSTNYYLSVRARDQAGNASAIIASSAWQLATPGTVSASGLELWYDANDLQTLFKNSGCSTAVTSNNDGIGCIHDKSGNDRHGAQSTSFNQPTYHSGDFNNKPSIYFDGGTDEFLSFSAITDIRTVFWVLKEDASNPGNTAFLLGWPEGATPYFHRDSTLGPIFHSSSASSEVTGGTLQQNGVSIDGTTTNMPTSEAVLSLVTTANVTATALSKDRNSCCANRTWGGSFAEIIIFSRVLNSTEIADIENELLLKWSINSAETVWTGAVSTNWFLDGNWTNNTPNATKDCVINNVANDPVISGATGICRTVTNYGDLTLANATGASLEIYGNLTNTGTINGNDGELVFRDNGSSATDQIINSVTALGDISFNKTAGGTLQTATPSIVFDSITMPTGSNFTFRVSSSREITVSNGLTIAGGIFEIRSAGTLKVGDGSAISITGGTLKTNGTSDAYPQSTANKAVITRASTGRFSINATAGTVQLQGFLIDYLDINGLQIGGTANLSQLDGGQFSNLLADFATPVKVIQLNTTTAITEALARNVGFNWSSANSTHSGSPAPSDSYYLVYAPNCNSAGLVFDQWFGDFYSGLGTKPEQKIHDTDDTGPTCQVTMDIAASPINLLSFNATAYDKSILLQWETGAESYHLGFNVYRSENYFSDYSQINPELIRNFNNSTTFRGNYRFEDTTLDNGKVYYYMIEDIGSDGSSTLHGPISTMPLAGLGNIPAPVISDVNNVDTPAAGSVDLGDGAQIVGKIEGTFRVVITPGTLSIETATWDNGYRRLFIPGFSRDLTPEHPELLRRKILIEVDNAFETLDVVQVDLATSDKTPLLTGGRISPVANWTTDLNGDLQPSFNLDSTSYSNTQFEPSIYYSVNPNPVSLQGKSYVELHIYPLAYRASTDSLTKLDSLILDIGVNGSAWSTDNLPTYLSLSPTAVSGGVRIRYSEAAMMELSFSDLVNSNVEGPLSNTSTGDLRLYYHGQERPIEIISTDSIFNDGDKLRFYAPFESLLEDQYDELVLTQFNFSDNGSIPLRIYSLANQFSNYPVSAPDFRRATITKEQNDRAIFDVPLGSQVDRFYWDRKYTLAGSTPNGNSRLDIGFNLSDYNPNNADWVNISVFLRGRRNVNLNPTHSVGIYVNGSVTLSESKAFQTDDPVELKFRLSPEQFLSGANTIRLEVLGDKIDAGDYDIIDFNKIVIDYPATYEATAGKIHIVDSVPDQQTNISGFSNQNILAYDITDPLDQFQYANMTLNDLGGGNWMTTFDAVIGNLGHAGKELYILDESSFSSPSQLLLTHGNGDYLVDASGAELIIIGDPESLDVLDNYIAHRQSQGISAIRVNFEQIYAEFSHGRKSSRAIRDFLSYALSSWAEKPQYVLFISDATYDPNDYLNKGGAAMHPIPIEGGQHLDFGSDNWFVETDESILPQLAIGRIPSSNSGQIKNYFDKLIDYETGVRSPTQSQATASVFLSGEDNSNESFNDQSIKLAETLKVSNNQFSTDYLDRPSGQSDSDAKQDIKNIFDQAPMFVTYVGHGAENSWGSNTTVSFDLEAANNLNNQRLPVVIGLNCLNAYFYDPDQTSTSLGEKLIFNENGGAIAFWGSTTMTAPMTQMNLASSFLTEVGQQSNQTNTGKRLGDLILTAKSTQTELGFNKDTIKSYTLFGDPSLKLPYGFFKPAAAVAPPQSTTPPPVQIITPDKPKAPITEPETSEPQAPVPPTAPAANNSGGGSSSGGGCSAFAAGSDGHKSSPRGNFMQLFEIPFLLLLMWMVLRLQQLVINTRKKYVKIRYKDNRF